MSRSMYISMEKRNTFGKQKLLQDVCEKHSVFIRCSFCQMFPLNVETWTITGKSCGRCLVVQ